MLNIPRIVLLFLCVSFTVPSLAETTTMQLPQLSLSLNNVTIREVFNIIEKNTEYVFIFSDELLTDLNGKVSIHVNKQTLDKILDKVLQSTGLTYKITNRQVTVSKKSQAVVQKTSLKVTGHVSDEKGEPLIGVNIQEEGTNNVVVTDMNGNFSMYNISGPSSVLKFYSVEGSGRKADESVGKARIRCERSGRSSCGRIWLSKKRERHWSYYHYEACRLAD